MKPNTYTEDFNIEKRRRQLDNTADPMPTAFWGLLGVLVVGCWYWATFS